MYNVGVFPMKGLPPHRGHLNAIINASTKCGRLYVVVSDHPELTKRLCNEVDLEPISLQLRAKWLSIELQSFDHIEVLMLDEAGIPEYPYGWTEWSKRLREVVPEEFDVIFGGEIEYIEQHKFNHPNVAYELYDCNRDRFPISATEIRKNPLKHWDYILGSARPYFAKKVLITGTESCGKSTITKYLAKIFHTSWAEEEGRYYSAKYLGGNEEVFTVEDFGRIAYLQRELENHAIKTANKITFFDTDALVTQFYCDMYLGETSNIVDSFIDPSRYDVVLMFTPDVKWVDDGLRWNSEDETRLRLHEQLKAMYVEKGFGDKIIEINGSYNERLSKAIAVVDELLSQ